MTCMADKKVHCKNLSYPGNIQIKLDNTKHLGHDSLKQNKMNNI